MGVNKTDLIAEFEPKREKAVKSFGIFLAVGIVVAVLGLVFIFALGNNNIFSLIGIILTVLGIVFIVLSFIKKSSFSKQLLAILRKNVLDTHFPNREERKAGMSKSEIMFPGFFAQPDRFYSSNFLSSEYNNIKFKSSDYELKRREVEHTKNGTTVTYVTYAKGTMYFFDFEREFGSTIKILEKNGGIGLIGGHGLKKAETEYIAFNKKFQILTNDETNVFYILTPQIQEKIMALEPLYKGQFYMAFIGSDLWVAINDNGTSLNFSAFKPLTEESIDKIEKLIATPKLLIDNLGLDKNKFKKNAGVDIK